jgi:glycosyltransferase involved in cell wall biosynthesis
VAETAEFTRLAKTWMPKLDLVITGSQTVKSEIHDYFGIPDERIVVVSEGCDHGGDKSELFASCVAADLGFPYFLTVNPSDVRKNLFRTLEAFVIYTRQAVSACEVKLVIAGVIAESDRFLTWKKDHPDMEGRVLHLGYVEEERLRSLYQGAIASIYVSLYEGFGIPIIESFRNNCAVIASDIPVFHEVAGDAACFVNPHDSNSLVDAMSQFHENATYRKDLIAKGLVRSECYSWSKSAEVALEALLRM